MKLLIGNKNYSSWSFRAWLTLKVCEVSFEEELRPFDVENNFADYFEFSPTGKVPVLIDSGQPLWESLAILEHVAEQVPSLWPSDLRQRAHARSIAHEMHAGFLALKSECPMNMRRRVEGIAISEAARKDVRRVEAIWAECLERYHGPFLFGSSFSIADGMFAPVVNRLQIYALSESPAVLRYTSAMTELPAWKQWHEDAVAEPWVVEIDEVYA